MTMPLLLLLALVACSGDASSTDSSGDSAAPYVGCQTIAVDTATLHWDAVEPGTVVTGTVSVQNTCTTGEDNLLVTASSSEAAFTVDRTSELSIAPGASVTLTVSFLAPDTSSHYGVLSLVSNDAAQPELFVALEGLVTTDADGDGFPNLGAGGDDCDDTNAGVHPGANEVWYDGVDEDCDGSSDYDQDGDGWPALAYGGNDCNDTSADIHPGATEVLDEVDQDCDGMVDEDYVLADEVVVSEVMPTPGGVADNLGEWFEVTNVGSTRIDLFGWQVVTRSGDTFTVDRHQSLSGGGRLVFGANADAVTNGNVHVDEAYDASTFSISASDSLTLKVDGRTINSIFFENSKQGVSVELDPDHFVAKEAGVWDWWCDSSTAMSGTDIGTPAEPNDQCTTVDEDGDGVSEADGDCDDTDASVNSSAVDVWDGVDNDCDGFVDNPMVEDVATAVLDGSGTTYLGATNGLSSGDVTGDGVDDLIVGSTYSSTYAGAAWVIDSADVIGATGVVSSVDTATVNGATYSYFGALPPTMADYDGDGTDDLVVGAGPYATYGGDAVDLFTGGSSLTGILDYADATTTVDEVTGAYTYGAQRLLSGFDSNGDGAYEVVYADPMANDGSRYYAGAVYVYDVTTGGALASDDTLATLSGTAAASYVGCGIAAGDIDGDGYDDLTVGAPGVTGAAASGGAVYVVSGSSLSGDQDIDDAADTVVYGSTRDDHLGASAPVLADLDGSGGLDLAVGGTGTDAVYLFFGASGLASELETADADTTITGTGSFGYSLYAADLDRDGRTDLAVGAPALSTTGASTPYYWWYYAGTGTGAVYFFDRDVMAAGGDHDSSESFRGLTGAGASDLFGSVLAGGDFDDDGTTDLAVAAPQAGARGATVPGAVYVVLGN